MGVLGEEAMSSSEHEFGLWSQFTEVSSRVGRADFLVYVLILCLGASQWFFIARESDFPDDQVFWADAGRSLLEHGFYGINGNRETNMPPGLPAVVGVLETCFGNNPSIILHAMVLFGCLAFLACYELLRRQVPRLVAAAICLLVMSSVTNFSLVTQTIWPPGSLYMLTTLSALLVARDFEKARSLISRIALGMLLTALVVASLSLASAAIALLGAMVARIASTFIWTRRLALSRLSLYLPVLVVGLAVQGLWMHHGGVEASGGSSASEWPLPGFPHSYLSQLMVKSGNDPDLGLAGPLDFAVRIADNARAHCELLSRILLRELPVVGWTSIFVVLPLLFIALGWCDSVWVSKGGGLQEWYFAGYEFIYLLWPWQLEPRLFLPIAPLGFLFMWRGGSVFMRVARNYPREVSVVSLPVTTILAVGAWFSIHGSKINSQHRFIELEDEFSFAVWVLLALLSAWVVWRDVAGLKSSSTLMQSLRRSSDALRINLRDMLAKIAAASVVGLIVLGLVLQVQGGRERGAAGALSPDAQAGAWIRAHTDKDVVLMARHVPSVSHYSERKVIWFPPTSDANMLMDGIARHKIDFVIVVHRENPYYLPPDDLSFAKLLAAYRDDFRLEYEAPGFRIFRVISNDHRSSKHGLSSAN